MYLSARSSGQDSSVYFMDLSGVYSIFISGSYLIVVSIQKVMIVPSFAVSSMFNVRFSKVDHQNRLHPIRSRYFSLSIKEAPR